jgi:hypothetical protein
MRSIVFADLLWLCGSPDQARRLNKMSIAKAASSLKPCPYVWR